MNLSKLIFISAWIFFLLVKVSDSLELGVVGNLADVASASLTTDPVDTFGLSGDIRDGALFLSFLSHLVIASSCRVEFWAFVALLVALSPQLPFFSCRLSLAVDLSAGSVVVATSGRVFSVGACFVNFLAFNRGSVDFLLVIQNY